MKLLSHGDGNTKLAKSNRLSDFTTYGLSLSPANESGYQTCSSSTSGCRAACIFTAGNGSYPVVINGRIRKTRLLFDDRVEFERQLRADLTAAVRKAKREHKRVAVRLNVFSDLQWESLMPWIFVEFPDVEFYDYTKHYLRMKKFLRGELPNNYHLTFSRSESNERKAIQVLMSGGNVAVVFERTSRFNPTIPESWHGISVMNGDSTDLRFLEGKQGKIVGLYAKGRAMGSRDGFVVNFADARQPLLSSM
jgi:hypothetical protein